jgi:hypothetical protein
MLLAPWPVCFVDWWIWTWKLLHKHGSRNQLYALCPMARRRIPLSPLKSREAYMILASLSPCFFWWLWNLVTYLSLSGVSTKQFAMQHLYWYGDQCIFGTNHQKHYTICVHECYYSLFTCQSRSLWSFISKSLSTVGQDRLMQPGSLPKNPFCSTPIVTVLM